MTSMAPAETDVLALHTGEGHPQPSDDRSAALGPCDLGARLGHEEREAERWSARSAAPAHLLRRLIENLQPDAKSGRAGSTITGVKDYHGAVPIKQVMRDRNAHLLRLFEALGGSECFFSASAARLCVHQVSVASTSSPSGRGREDNDGAMKDEAGYASESHYYSRACSDQTTRGSDHASASRFQRAPRQGAMRAESCDMFAAGAANHPIGGKDRLSGSGTGALLGSAGPRHAVSFPANSQGFGPDTSRILKLSWLDGASVEVHNFLAKRGVKDTEAGTRRADSYEAAVEAALAERGRGKNTAEPPFEAGVHRGAELQMSQLVAHIRCKPKGRGAARLREKRALLPVGQRDMLSVALVQRAARSYLKPSEQRLERMRPEGAWFLIPQADGVGNVARGRAVSPQRRCDRAQLDAARQSCRTESVIAFRKFAKQGRWP